MIIKSKWFTKLLGVRGIVFPWPLVFVRTKDDIQLLKHEMIHWHQAKASGGPLWYLRYFYFHFKYGYRNNPYELECWLHQHEEDYIPTRTSYKKHIDIKLSRDFYDKDGKLIPRSERFYYIKQV